MIILKLKDIEKSYKKRNKTISVLKEVNYDFKSNKLYTISGRSGAGKTTLINILGLISKPTNGEVIIENTNTKILNDKSLSKIRSEKKTKASSNGIIVKGIDNCLVRFSKCCNPLPGDEIVGYITKGRGVSVHRKDCVNVKDLFKEENRIIDVFWEEEEHSSYNVDIEIFANDRIGLLSDVVKVISATKVNIIGVNSKLGKDRIAIIDITIETKNLDELNSLIRSIHKVDSVYEVKRKKV